MKRKSLVVAVLFGVVFVASFAAAAVAGSTEVQYGPGNLALNPGEGLRSGWTGLGWTENYMDWSDPQGGTPNMCSNYLNTSLQKLKTDKCSGVGFVDDTRAETNYAAASCKSSSSNNYVVVLTDGCFAWHNTTIPVARPHS